MTPRCYNREEWAGLWVATGRIVRGKTVWRWWSHRMSQRCAAWDSGPSHISYSVPAMGNWACLGCVHIPDEAKEFLSR